MQELSTQGIHADRRTFLSQMIEMRSFLIWVSANELAAFWMI
ncbi:hypothetical protein RLO149_c032910 [Roseobacter litoralis Och 149]|uniref:Uncharacterized protein n=1 Tax=Roseobacter litoralis (strain ATCC 49566 / DSM 6996 / JCM 21268 / NBRC 15278 / OCh 149) TaxID=391595 RepID=F7ZKM1_ROSLO|nr:hypothetical protein RLO149_c032910 [Roseobacter litoralis Och 149]